MLCQDFLLGCLCDPVINFPSSVQQNGLPGEGRNEGLVPGNDVLTSDFMGFSLARTLARILFVPRLRPPPPPKKPKRRCEPEEGYLRCSKRVSEAPGSGSMVSWLSVLVNLWVSSNMIFLSSVN